MSNSPKAPEAPKRCACPAVFDRVNQAALTRCRQIIAALLPNGETSGTQYVVVDQDERRIISVFFDTGKWIELDAVAHGDGLVGLIAHALDLRRCDPARLIAHLLGIEWGAAPDIDDTTNDAQ